MFYRILHYLQATDGSSSCSCLYDEGGRPTSRTCEGPWDVDSIGLHWGISQSLDQWETVQVEAAWLLRVRRRARPMCSVDHTGSSVTSVVVVVVVVFT